MVSILLFLSGSKQVVERPTPSPKGTNQKLQVGIKPSAKPLMWAALKH